MGVQVGQQAVIEACLTAGVLQLDSREPMRDRGPEHSRHGGAPDRLVHTLGRLVYVAVGAAQVAGIRHVQPGRERAAVGELGAWRLTNRMDQLKLAQAPKDVVCAVISRLPGSPHLLDGGWLREAPE